MSKKSSFLTFLFVAAGFLLSGCGPRPVPAEATPLGFPPDVADAAKQELSDAIDVPMEDIAVVRANQVEWTDTCLELGGPDEFCGQALTPGWRIVLEAEGTEYEVHTDLGADTVRLKES